jgi:diguanylate cyclase
MPDNHSLSPQPLFYATEQGDAVNGTATVRKVSGAALLRAATRHAHTPPPSAPGDVAMADWHDLLNAVKSRLLMTAHEDFSESRSLRPAFALEQVQSEMIDCVAALNQLHSTLSHELERHRNLKHDIAAAQAALAHKHSELVGTQAQERRARHLSRHDGLTSLPNRDYFLHSLDQALARQLELAERESLAVVFLDLDLFKLINDTHGHAVGDEVLKIVADRLSHTIRAEDSVSRLGGDEFACLLGGFPDRPHIRQHAAKVLAAVSEPMEIGGLTLVIRPSIGIAMCPGDGLTSPALLEHADIAMYSAKRRSLGFAFYDEIPQR